MTFFATKHTIFRSMNASFSKVARAGVRTRVLMILFIFSFHRFIAEPHSGSPTQHGGYKSAFFQAPADDGEDPGRAGRRLPPVAPEPLEVHVQAQPNHLLRHQAASRAAIGNTKLLFH
jgi:hypothetical protein